MISFAAVALAVWLLAVGGWWIATRFFRKSDAAKIRQRVIQAPVEPKPAGRKSKAGKVELITTEDRVTGRIVLALMERYRLMDRIQKLLEQAGLKWRPARLAHVSLALFLTGFIIGWQCVPGNRLLVDLAIGAFLGVLPWLHVLRLRRKRLDAFEEQFPESLEFLARSMRAGHAFSASLEMIHKEFQEPLAGEFRRVFEEHNLGIPLDAALQKMGQRIPSLDVQFFISAVLLQKRTGGNLAEILDKLAYLIRERFKLRGKIRAISAHGRMTGAALSLIPVFVAGMMFWVNPGYIQFFFEDETGRYMAGAAIGLQLIGYAIIQKIVSIEV